MTYHRSRAYRRPMSTRQKAAVSAVAVALLLGAKNVTHHHGHAHSSAAASPAAARAIAYARHQLGKPYAWGGTGPYGYDCSGLTEMAYASTGVTIPRTAAEQFAAGHRVSHPERGDEVFFAGSDGTATDPGHVGLVINPAKHQMIEAYSTGFPIRISTYGLPSSAEGDTDPVGFTDPTAGRH